MSDYDSYVYLNVETQEHFEVCTLKNSSFIFIIDSRFELMVIARMRIYIKEACFTTKFCFSSVNL